jgi:hypothetical protein
MIRTDIRSYYASIDHALLQSMIRKHFDDANVLRYLCNFVDVPIDRGGWYEHPKKGIPIGSSLSCFFAALVLKPLDQCFDHRDDLYYCRYNDDIIILCKTKRQYTQAKRRLNTIIMALKLKVAPKKTRTGSIEKGFHFLGIQFAVARTTASSSRKDRSLTSVDVSLHPRSIRRSMMKVRLKQEERFVSHWEHEHVMYGRALHCNSICHCVGSCLTSPIVSNICWFGNPPIYNRS